MDDRPPDNNEYPTVGFHILSESDQDGILFSEILPHGQGPNRGGSTSRFFPINSSSTSQMRPGNPEATNSLPQSRPTIPGARNGPQWRPSRRSVRRSSEPAVDFTGNTNTNSDASPSTSGVHATSPPTLSDRTSDPAADPRTETPPANPTPRNPPTNLPGFHTFHVGPSMVVEMGGEGPWRRSHMEALRMIFAYYVVEHPRRSKASSRAIRSLKRFHLDELPEGEEVCSVCYEAYTPVKMGPEEKPDDISDKEHPSGSEMNRGTSDSGRRPSQPSDRELEVDEDDHCAVSMPCGHIFGLSCLHSWLKTAPSCPLCRASIESEQDDAPDPDWRRDGEPWRLPLFTHFVVPESEVSRRAHVHRAQSHVMSDLLATARANRGAAVNSNSEAPSPMSASQGGSSTSPIDLGDSDDESDPGVARVGTRGADSASIPASGSAPGSRSDSRSEQIIDTSDEAQTHQRAVEAGRGSEAHAIRRLRDALGLDTHRFTVEFHTERSDRDPQEYIPGPSDSLPTEVDAEPPRDSDGDSSDLDMSDFYASDRRRGPSREGRQSRSHPYRRSGRPRHS